MAVHPRYLMAPFVRWMCLAASIALVFAMQASPVRAAAIEGLTGCATNTLSANDDESTGAVDLGFTANFFGTMYSSVYVNNNGNVTFTDPLPGLHGGSSRGRRAADHCTLLGGRGHDRGGLGRRHVWDDRHSVDNPHSA